jgi:N-acetylneuraminate synthase
MEAEFSIQGRKVGIKYPPLVIAEIGINHEGDLDLAIKMADEAINAGAEIIKHQTHIIEDEMSDEAKQIIPGNASVSIYEIMKRCALNENDEKKLMNHIVSRGAIFISTPFSREATNRLMKFNVPAYKIGSGECSNYPLVKYIAKAKKPVILSTGMNNIETIRPSVEILRSAKIPYALLHCTNIYPTPPNLVRLGALSELKENFPDAVIGLSDHTTNNYACFGAVALGASILERHFTDNMKRPGPDIVCSMDPSSLRQLIEGCHTIFFERGGKKNLIPDESQTMNFAFASVVAFKDISKGDYFTEDNLWVRRPSGGDYSAQDYESLIGKKSKNFIKKGSRICKEDLYKDE